MDINDFLSTTAPAGKRSVLEPFLEEIQMLRKRNYTLDQIRQYLAANDVEVSIPAISKFIKLHEARKTAVDCAIHGENGATAAPAPAAESTQEKPPISSADLKGLDKKQRREKIADQFIKGGNQLFKRLNKEQK